MSVWRCCCVAAGLSMSTGCDDENTDQGERRIALPGIAYCDPVRDWAEPDEELELALVDRINEHRTDGADCGDRGRMPPSPPLRFSGGPWCAARVHAADMTARDFVHPINPDGERPWDRLRATGYEFAVADEVLGAGDVDADPIAVVDELWMTRSGSCAGLMAPEYRDVGAGWVTAPEGSAHAAYFTVVVGRSRTPLRNE